MLGHGARMTAAGMALGLAAAAVCARYLSRMMFGVTPLDAPTFAAVCVAVTVVTICAAYIPARRATKVDPLGCCAANKLRFD